MIYAGTGHRPPRLSIGYDSASRKQLYRFVREQLQKFPDVGRVISGGAQGFDQALAAASISLGIKLTVAVPFEGQDANWPTDAKTFYHWLLGRADNVVIICKGEYANWKYTRRDEYMVDHADHVLSLLDDGTKKSGTRLTVEHAHKQGVPVTNLWSEWVAFRGK